MVYLFYATFTSVDLAHHEVFVANVGKGGIKAHILQNERGRFWLEVPISHVVSIDPRIHTMFYTGRYESSMTY